MATGADNHITLQKGELAFTFLKSGDLYEVLGGGIMINQLLTNAVDGMAGNLYLRIHGEEDIAAYPLLGVKSSSRFRQDGESLVWEGALPASHSEIKEDSVKYQVVFTLTQQGVWFWEVKVTGAGETADVIYAQDVGIAGPGAVRSNEAYLSQYIDHRVFNDAEKGYVVCSRQNQPQNGAFPYLQQGLLNGASGYSTDGFQFYGLSYKETDRPEALARKTLPSKVYQYEFAYTALQSETVRLAQEPASFTFYGLFEGDHPEAVTRLEFEERLNQALGVVRISAEQAEQGKWLEPVTPAETIGEPVQTLPLTREELDTLYPNRAQEELRDGELLSFFTETYEHVVLKSKELQVERPHGTILMSGSNATLNPEVLTTTSYMYGVFNSQVVVGNTNFNKMMSNMRNALNVQKTSGQRIYVELDGKFRLLTMPSLFEMGFNYARWHYKTHDETFVITNYTVADSPELKLHLSAASGRSYRFLISSQITMHVAEYEVPFRMERDDKGRILTFNASEGSTSSQIFPKLAYTISVDGADYSVHDGSCLTQGPGVDGASLVVLELAASAEWTLTLQGLLEGGTRTPVQTTASREVEKYRHFFAGLMNGFKLTAPGGEEERLFKVNALAWWYTHNMLVHYSVPHGLEQYGGAAWGTRDVCQGPVEYFLSMQKYEQVREIIRTVFAHQYEDDGSWPQWFMFDKYSAIQQEDSHGDIIVWPLKVLGDYLRATSDYSVLDEQVPYTVKEGFSFTESTATIRDHAKKELQYIVSHFLHDTYLSSYGDGDWDDTLQPANAQLKQYMVSSWTVALTYQTVLGLSRVLKIVEADWSAELLEMAEGIKRDFNRYMLGTEVIPGFLYFEDPEAPKLMLHPEDRETGIQYRLLPMTRSMIGELLPPERMEAQYKLITEQFLCPDGVRLMNRPASYEGGVSTHFKRAEQASNFGREIGLQYVHAHIRFVEAMAKIGKRDQVWSGLAAINPVGIREVVPNAELRQSNAYFSSSDGKFSDRYEAQRRFGELRTGSVPVKGGWRIYSSGPGIYMHQLICNVLGIREEGGNLVIDPVLPDELDGMTLHFTIGGLPASFTYRISTGSVRSLTVNRRMLAGERIANPYRTGGLKIKRDELESCRSGNESSFEVIIEM